MYHFLDEQSIFPPEEAGTESFNCPDDYLVINGIRLCGGRFNDGTIITDHTMSAPVTGTALFTACNASFNGFEIQFAHYANTDMGDQF